MRSLYVHVPFCKSKCPYCDFTSFNIGVDTDKYLGFLLKELSFYREKFDLPIHSIYFGGGTPSILPAEFYMNFLRQLKGSIGVSEKAEVTLEANPGTIDRQWLSEIGQAGINRLSIGVQSFDDHELITLGRNHTAETAIKAIADAKHSGLNNISIDLMFGIPGQTVDSWKSTLNESVRQRPNHISIYPLTISGDCSWNFEKHGYLPDEDIVADMYADGCERLEEAGLAQYEISNFSTPGFECVHNLNYWAGGDYIGLGVSAHSKVEDTRFWNVTKFKEYESALLQGSVATDDSEKLDKELLLAEKLILQLRLNKGVDINHFIEENGAGNFQLFDSKLDELSQAGLIQIRDRNIRLTKRAKFMANHVFSELLP